MQMLKTLAESEAKPQQETFVNNETFSHAKTFASDIKERAAAQNELQRFKDSRKHQT